MSQDDAFRLAELALQGYGCSQVLVLRALEKLGTRSPELVRAVSGLHGGLGFSGKVCGALTGGCCVLGLHAGRAEATEAEGPDLQPMVQALVKWFEEEVGAEHGGIDCADILEGDARNQVKRCPAIVARVAAKVDELLEGREHA